MKEVNFRIEAKANDNLDREYRFDLEIYIFKDGHAYVSYCPSLDISTSGKTFNDAVKNFYEMFQMHIEYCVKNNTLIQDLKNHGWVISNDALTPPNFTNYMNNSDVISLLNSNKNYQRIYTPVSFVANLIEV